MAPSPLNWHFCFLLLGSALTVTYAKVVKSNSYLGGHKACNTAYFTPEKKLFYKLNFQLFNTTVYSIRTSHVSAGSD